MGGQCSSSREMMADHGCSPGGFEWLDLAIFWIYNQKDLLMDWVWVWETLRCQEWWFQLLVWAKRKELFIEMDKMARRAAVGLSESHTTDLFCRVGRVWVTHQMKVVLCLEPHWRRPKINTVSLNIKATFSEMLMLLEAGSNNGEWFRQWQVPIFHLRLSFHGKPSWKWSGMAEGITYSLQYFSQCFLPSSLSSLLSFFLLSDFLPNCYAQNIKCTNITLLWAELLFLIFSTHCHGCVRCCKWETSNSPDEMSESKMLFLVFRYTGWHFTYLRTVYADSELTYNLPKYLYKQYPSSPQVLENINTVTCD